MQSNNQAEYWASITKKCKAPLSLLLHQTSQNSATESHISLNICFSVHGIIYSAEKYQEWGCFSCIFNEKWWRSVRNFLTTIMWLLWNHSIAVMSANMIRSIQFLILVYHSFSWKYCQLSQQSTKNQSLFPLITHQDYIDFDNLRFGNYLSHIQKKLLWPCEVWLSVPLICNLYNTIHKQLASHCYL